MSPDKTRRTLTNPDEPCGKFVDLLAVTTISCIVLEEIATDCLPDCE
jgi:hypothetical protein